MDDLKKWLHSLPVFHYKHEGSFNPPYLLRDYDRLSSVLIDAYTLILEGLPSAYVSYYKGGKMDVGYYSIRNVGGQFNSVVDALASLPLVKEYYTSNINKPPVEEYSSFHIQPSDNKGRTYKVSCKDVYVHARDHHQAIVRGYLRYRELFRGFTPMEVSVGVSPNITADKEITAEAKQLYQDIQRATKDTLIESINRMEGDQLKKVSKAVNDIIYEG